MARRLAGDESAAFPVLEAILVALLILSTILFFTSLQRPTTATDEGGIDLGRLAADTLSILQTKQFTLAGCMSGLGVEQWVGATLNSTNPSSGTASTCVADEVESFLSEVLPPGTQFQLRLDNGVEPLVLVPAGSTETPRAARAAATYITPLWLSYQNRTTSQAAYPGQEITVGMANATAFVTNASIKCIEGPSGKATGPGGVTWVAHWQPALGPGEPPRVPDDIPYGAWAGYSAASATSDCTGSPTTYLFVGLADGTTTDFPVYALQLVVWFGA